MNGDRQARLRFFLFRALVLCSFLVIAYRLWDLQVVSSQEYQSSADRNRYRLVPVDSPRGIIYDRLGRFLVRNVPSFTVSIVPAGLPEGEAARRAVLSRVGELLDMPVESLSVGPSVSSVVGTEATLPLARGPQTPGIEEILQERTISSYAPVRIASNVDRQAAFIIEEEHLELPGVVVAAQPLRHYVDGPLTAHILGCVGSIPSDQLKHYVERAYQPDDLVGLTGIELTQEAYLRGTKGEKHIEVDAFEREVSLLALRPAVQGHSVILTLDLELQRVVEQALHEAMRTAGSRVGVVVAIDPRTGEILAMVSLPSYDNNLFSGGISYEDYVTLSTDRYRPLVNHAISGLYPPGSTFKIVATAGALQDGIVDSRTLLTCQGTLLLPNKYFPDDWTKAQTFYCWAKSGHGALNVVGALRQSCDIYLYRIAGGYQEFEGLGIECLADYARMFGFGEPTGIELSGEAAGLVPSDRWKRQNYGENWVTGDTYNAAIGQGYVLATPLQLLNGTVAVANGGTLYGPRLVYQIIDAEGKVVHALSPEVAAYLDISPENLALVRQGMREAVTHGTAWMLDVPSIEVAGKTGTAEYPGLDDEGNLMLDDEGNLPTHAWFTAFAPYQDPEIAVVVFLEGGGEGSQTAVPVASEILRYYFGIPEPEIDPTPTQETQ